MCTLSEIASQQMKTIQGGEDKKTDLKKFSQKKATDRSCQKKKEGGKPFKPEKKRGKQNPKILPSRTASIAVVNNAM